MEKFNRADLKEFFDNQFSAKDKGIQLGGAETDSRKVKSGDTFFALVGDRVNGHQFVEEVLRRGAAAVVANPKYLQARILNDPAVVRVKKTGQALFDLAKFYRQKFSIPCIGITGSTGKTTTKEILGTLLKEKYIVLKTEGNFNTEIGCPLTLMKLSKGHQVGVLEMGAHKKGDIAQLTELVAPLHGIVTNVGHGHLQYFKTLQNITDEKAELIKALPPGGFAILNFDDARVRMMGKKSKAGVTSFGITEKAEVSAKSIEAFLFQTRFQLDMGTGKVHDVSLPLSGLHNVYNCLAAVAAAKIMGLTEERILQGIKKIKMIKQRQEILVKRGLTIINDTYNANPESMLAALKFLGQLDHSRRKLAILGDMNELGEISDKAHSKLGEIVALQKIDLLYTFGEKSELISQAAAEKGMNEQCTCHFTSKEKLISKLKKDIKSSDIILIKGSRGMTLETVADALCTS